MKNNKFLNKKKVVSGECYTWFFIKGHFKEKFSSGKLDKHIILVTDLLFSNLQQTVKFHSFFAKKMHMLHSTMNNMAAYYICGNFCS